tara:strand:- start:32512 stop:32754 length:243 start_codon:yes stop_codon:yes gene_type:complete
MPYDNRKYVIFDTAEVSSINFSEVIEKSPETLRYSIDNSQTILKFTGDTPSFLTGETQYTHSEICAIIQNPDNGWVDNED